MAYSNRPNIWIAPEGGNFRKAEARQCTGEKREERKPGRSGMQRGHSVRRIEVLVIWT